LIRLAITSDVEATNPSGLANLDRLVDSGRRGQPLDRAGGADARAREHARARRPGARAGALQRKAGEPFEPDQVYHVMHDRAGVDEDMYLFACDYSLNEDSGQSTLLHFCKLGTIVAGAEAP
jgi:prophage tail gpP-like protein